MSDRQRRRRAGHAQNVVSLEDDIIPLEPPANRRRRRQREGNENRPIDVETVPDQSCIDLTDDLAGPAEFVDLTDLRSIPESPILIMSTPSDSGRLTRSMDRHRGDGDTVSVDNDDDLPVFDIGNLGFIEDAPAPSTASDEANNTPGRSITCPVCLDSAKEIRRSSRRLMSTTCGHIFCSECIRAAVVAQKKCPSCRKTLSMRQVHAIFL